MFFNSVDKHVKSFVYIDLLTLFCANKIKQITK